MTRKRIEYRKKRLSEELDDRYIYLEELLIKSRGYIVILKKVQTKGGEPINLDILDLKREVDFAIGKIIRKLDRRLKLYDVPNGMKK